MFTYQHMYYTNVKNLHCLSNSTSYENYQKLHYCEKSTLFEKFCPVQKTTLVWKLHYVKPHCARTHCIPSDKTAFYEGILLGFHFFDLGCILGQIVGSKVTSLSTTRKCMCLGFNRPLDWKWGFLVFLLPYVFWQGGLTNFCSFKHC